MEGDRYVLEAISEIKTMLSELKKEIREDISCHKKENEVDIIRLYDMIGAIKEKMIRLDTEYNSFRKLSAMIMTGVAGAIITAIMSIVMK